MILSIVPPTLLLLLHSPFFWFTLMFFIFFSWFLFIFVEEWVFFLISSVFRCLVPTSAPCSLLSPLAIRCLFHICLFPTFSLCILFQGTEDSAHPFLNFFWFANSFFVFTKLHTVCFCSYTNTLLICARTHVGALCIAIYSIAFWPRFLQFFPK